MHPALVACLAVAVLFGIGFVQRKLGKSPGQGRPAPDFALEIVGDRASLGDRVHLDELKGKTVLLDFWATWCEPCQVVAPILQRISRKHQGGDLVIVGVNTSDQPGLASVFATRKGLTYPIVYDRGDEVARLYGVTNLPTLVVINPKGEIAAMHTGVESESDLEDLIREAQ